jgi:hypothetical protein
VLVKGDFNMRKHGFDNEETKVDWNMNNAWLMEIMNLWREAAVYRQKKDDSASLESYWDALRSIWASMAYDIDTLIWSKKDADNNDELVKKQIELITSVEENFKKANNMFMHAGRNVDGATSQALKILDELENQLKYLTGALNYYKFRREQTDGRYSR